jgi:hypothetical protein
VGTDRRRASGAAALRRPEGAPSPPRAARSPPSPRRDPSGRSAGGGRDVSSDRPGTTTPRRRGRARGSLSRSGAGLHERQPQEHKNTATAGSGTPAATSTADPGSSTPSRSGPSPETLSPGSSANPLPPSTLPTDHISTHQDGQFTDQAVTWWDTGPAGAAARPSDPDLVAIGHSICSEWHAGKTVAEVKRALLADTQLGAHNVAGLVVSAGQNLCPQDYPPDGG